MANKKHELHISIDKSIHDKLVYYNKATGKTITRMIEESLGRYFVRVEKELEVKIEDDIDEA